MIAEWWVQPPPEWARDKRQSLLYEGLKLFHRQGVGGTGVAEIMQRAGAGKGQFYHYFASKEDFVCEVARFALELFWQQAREAGPLDSLERFDAWFQPYLDMGQLSGNLGFPMGSLALEQSPARPEVQRVVAEQMQRWIDFLKDSLASLVGCEKADGLARTLALEIQGALLMGRAFQSPRLILAVKERWRQRLETSA